MLTVKQVKARYGKLFADVHEMAEKVEELQRAVKGGLLDDDLRTRLYETREIVEMCRNNATVNTGEHEVLTQIFTGQIMYVDPRDLSVAPHLMMRGIWEWSVTTAWREVVKEGDIVLDIGANFGYFGVIAASLVKPKKVIFVEANSKLVPYIKKSMSVNGLLDKAVVENVAVGDKNGTITMNFLENHYGSSSGLDLGAEVVVRDDTVEQIEVKLELVDTIAGRNEVKRADVVKLDVEGLEPEAYTGMKSLVENSPNLKMFIEFTPGRYKDATGFFKRLRADFNYVYEITEPDGKLEIVKSYDALDFSKNDSVMLLVAKNAVS